MSFSAGFFLLFFKSLFKTPERGKIRDSLIQINPGKALEAQAINKLVF